jgi:putative ATPase
MTDSLFNAQNEPLANKLRPTSLNDVLGQPRVIEILKKLKRPVSILFYGDTGTGKTTIAKIMSKNWNLPFHHLNAVSTGVKEVKELIQLSSRSGSLVLFLDEIHRFSSTQQDSMLEAVESGKIILIGATTENPAFRVNKALLSRVQVFRLEKLTEKEMKEIYLKAQKEFHLPELQNDALEYIFSASCGDARKFLNTLELLSAIEIEESSFSLKEVEEILSARVIEYDKNKESHYDYISAFIKSVRGSDPDAALLYLAAMLEGGEDPLFIMRRLLILASEDIGNASIYGLILAESALATLERIGMPEGRIILSQVTCFLASCPKSNSSYAALARAQEFILQNGKSLEVPKHLRNAPTFLHKREGNSDGYQYPHDFADGFIEESYFPLQFCNNPPQFYFPTSRGTDKTLKDRLKQLWEKSGLKKYDL